MFIQKQQDVSILFLNFFTKPMQPFCHYISGSLLYTHSSDNLLICLRLKHIGSLLCPMIRKSSLLRSMLAQNKIANLFLRDFLPPNLPLLEQKVSLELWGNTEIFYVHYKYLSVNSLQYQ